MKKVLKWIILVLSIIAIPGTLLDLGANFSVAVFALMFEGLIIGVMISDLKSKKEVK